MEDAEQIPDAEFVPTEAHLALCAEVETLLEKWRWLPWVQPWHITVHPFQKDPCENFHTMEIQMMGYINCARLMVADDAGTDDVDIFPPGEYSLELTLLHELCHLLFDRIRTHAFNVSMRDGGIHESAFHVLETEEEVAVWSLCRGLAEMSKRLETQELHANDILLGPGLMPRRKRRPVTASHQSGSGASA